MANLALYFDTDKTLAIELVDDQQQAFDYSAFDEINLAIFKRQNQLDPDILLSPTITDGKLLFETDRDDSITISKSVMYYELEYFMDGKRGVFFGDRIIVQNVPSDITQNELKVTLDDLTVVNVTGAVNTAQAIQAKADAEAAKAAAETSETNAAASAASAEDKFQAIAAATLRVLEQTDDYIVFSPVSPATVIVVQETITFPWGSADVTVDTLEINNLIVQ